MKKREIKAKAKEAQSSQEVKPDDKTVNQFINVKKGKASVDDKCYQKFGREIYTDADGNQYSTYLMNSDIKDNKNKFYVLQLHQQGSNYYIYTRYGRVGEQGTQNSELMGLEAAIKIYNKTFKTKISGSKKYIAIELKTEEAKNSIDLKKTNSGTNIKIKPSKLDQSVQDLINFIYDKKLMEQQVMSAGYDPKKLPLGNLSEDTVKMGYKILCEIEEILKKPNKSGNFTSQQISQLEELSGKFYTLIPHDFGRQKMINFVINTLDSLKQKIDLIQSLVDINIAFKAAENKKKTKQAEKKNKIIEEDHPIDKNYDALKCQIRTIDKNSEIFKMIDQYIQNTNEYQKIELVDCFDLEREGEDDIFNPLDLKNHRLLWHGSRFSNYVGILSNGMRIAPPEAPRHGYLLGKGAYFADMISKSINYCDTGSSKNFGFLVLCQIALGDCYELKRHDSNADFYVTNNYKTVQSTHAQGTELPDPKDDKIVECEVNGKKQEYKIPLGKITKRPDGIHHSEFVVYNTNQIKLRYLVKVKQGGYSSF